MQRAGAPHFKVCAGCHVARYCNAACQRSDWLSHRQLCQQMQQVQQQAQQASRAQRRVCRAITQVRLDRAREAGVQLVQQQG